VQQANVRLRQNRAAEAEAVLRQARELPQAAPYDAGILFSLATVVQQGLKEPLRAAGIYRELVETHPNDSAVAQSLLRLGMALAEAGQPDSAQAALARCESAAKTDPGLASQARFLSARILMNNKQTADGLRCLRSVTTDFPRTEAGLQAPLEIAGYYRQAGDKSAESAILREAEEEYGRIIQDLAGTRGQESVVMGALDRLANVKAGVGDYEGAVEVLEKRADAFPRDAGSPLALVQAAALKETRLSDRPGSIALLEKMVQRYPAYPLTQKVKDKIDQLKAGS
jgi:tetratricopeptide (TPR) repeat protein